MNTVPDGERNSWLNAPLPLLSDIQHARTLIQGAAIRTPLVKLNVDVAGAEIFLKLENLQPIGSFKIRGAANAMRRLAKATLERGVITASAGNMAQGVSWMARELNTTCTVIAPDTAPKTKIDAIERLGGKVIKVSFDDWWRAFQERSFPGISGTFIHAFDDLNVMAGNGTIALEILEDLPDVEALVVPWGGGGLACGIATVMRELHPACRIFAAEVSTAAPLRKSLDAGEPRSIDYIPSFIDGISGKTVFPGMFDRAKQLLDGSLVTEVSKVAAAVRLLVERNRVVAEGAGACPVACAIDGLAGSGKIVCVVSGGNINTNVLCELFA